MDDLDSDIQRLKRAIERAKALNKQLRFHIGELTRLIEKSRTSQGAADEPKLVFTAPGFLLPGAF